VTEILVLGHYRGAKRKQHENGTHHGHDSSKKEAVAVSRSMSEVVSERSPGQAEKAP
jgi:hypothetical protein